MNASSDNHPKSQTTIERTSEREVVVTRTVNAPARIVFEAWTKAELFQQWWVPKSAGLTLLSCHVDARAGGGYRLVFGVQGTEVAFFGTYLEVTPHSRIVWTNEEAHGDGQISTVTFEEKAGKTLVVMHELYPSKAALDGAMSGSLEAMPETFQQLDDFVVALASR